MFTIGELAKRVGLRTSALRYYEAEGLLKPSARTESGYRLYGSEAEQTLRFIQRAQRLGFSLADIHTLLDDSHNGALSDDTVATIAEDRFIALTRQLTELLVLRHELGLLLLDLRQTRLGQSVTTASSLFDHLLDRVCADPGAEFSPNSTLDWLFERTHCALASLDEQNLIGALRGRHVHIWKEDQAYRILITGNDPGTETALRELAELEAKCHAHSSPQLEVNDEGFLFTASGEHAFLFAQLFLALEQTA